MGRQLKIVAAKADHRRHRRWRNSRLGRIEAPGRSNVIEVFVLDWSASGVQFAIEDRGSLPDVFELVLNGPSDPRVRCALKWRRGDRCGAVFI